jgi:endogenous inhibitor of DNA gyrase (YacG/DUF329 family)
MSDARIAQTLDALVEEAYAFTLKKGTAITDPTKWREWKRRTYIETAKREGPGYLAQQYERLGLGANYPERSPCTKCGAPIVGQPWLNDKNKPHCSPECAGVSTLTFAEFVERITPKQREQIEQFLPQARRLTDDMGKT